MIKAKVTRKSHARREGGRLKTYNPGDELKVTEREMKAFGDRLERLSSDESDDSPQSEIDVLRERARELGVDFDNRWGVPKMTEAIKAAEAGDESQGGQDDEQESPDSEAE